MASTRICTLLDSEIRNVLPMIPVKGPGSGQRDCLRPTVPLVPGLWILKNDLAGRCVRDRLKRAKTFEVYRHSRALGIGDFPELAVPK